jgi:hypothetical protein
MSAENLGAVLLIVTALLNVTGSILNMRSARRNLRNAKQNYERAEDVVKLVAFASLVAHPSSPVPEAVRATARQALPSWVQVEFGVVPPGSDRVQ